MKLFPRTSRRAGLVAGLLFIALSPAAFAQFTIDETPIPDAAIGSSYAPVPLPTTGGFGPITWSFFGSPVPPTGFSIGAASFEGTTGTFCWGTQPACSGNVQGFPGNYLFTVRARDSHGQTADRQFTVRLHQELLFVAATLPDVQVNTAYLQQLQATGGTGSYVWSIVNGSLPPGLELSANSGAISGTAGALAGVYAFSVQVQDTVSGINATRAFSIRVVSGIEITFDATLPLTVVNQTPEPFQFRAVGGTSYHWSLPPSSLLPQNFSLSTDGLLTGTGTVSGSYRFFVRVTDVSQASAQKQFTLHVTRGQLRIVENLLPSAALNTPYQATVTAAGGIPPYTFSFTTLDIHGLLLNATTGAITGTPDGAGNNIPLPISLIDATGTRVTRTFQVPVLGQLVLTTTSLPNGAVGAPYSRTLGVTGGEQPYRWTVTSGSTPVGLRLDPNTGILDGTPVNADSTTFTVQVEDAVGRTSVRQFTMVVGPGVVITTTTFPDGIVGRGYTLGLLASGGALPLTWTVVNGSLPAGLAIDAVTGVITGTVAVRGTSTFTMRVTDAAANHNDRVFTLEVVDPLVITTGTLPGSSRNVGYSQTLGVSGGRGPFSWSVTAGALPAGLTLAAATGVISGTPSALGSSNFTIGVSDTGGQTASATLTLVISEALIITSGSFNGQAGQAFSQTITAEGGFPPYAWSIAAGVLPAGLVLNAGTGQVTGIPALPSMTLVTFQVTDASQRTATKDILITFGFPPLPKLTLTVPDNPQAVQQPSFGLALATPFAGGVAGTVGLEFVSPAGADDTIRFVSGTRTLAFVIAAGTTQAQFYVPGQPDKAIAPVFLTGTVAGTITLTVRNVLLVQPGFPSVVVDTSDVAKSITIARNAPVISSVVLERSATSINVVVTGYSSTREISAGTFRFSVGQTNPIEIQMQLGTAFSTWFQNTSSNATGGQFRLTIPFAIQGNSSVVTSVGVTLTNAQGVSNPVAAQ